MARRHLAIALGTATFVAACGGAPPPAPTAAGGVATPRAGATQPAAPVRPLATVRIGVLGLNMSNAGIEPRLGLKTEDLNQVYMPFPEMAAALRNGAVAAAMPIEPGLTAIVKQGFGEIAHPSTNSSPMANPRC